MRDPIPVRVHEKLEASDAGRCRRCHCWLYYQRIESLKFPEHFFFCASCGRRYAAGETGWTPGGSPRPTGAS